MRFRLVLFQFTVIGAAVVIIAAGSPAKAVDFVVNSTADMVDLLPGDGVCDADPGPATVCTLRAAVQEANALPNDPSQPAPFDRDRIGLYGGTYTLTIPGRDEDQAATGDLDLTETVEILGDDTFESGDTCLWSDTIGEPPCP